MMMMALPEQNVLIWTSIIFKSYFSVHS